MVPVRIEPLEVNRKLQCKKLRPDGRGLLGFVLLSVHKGGAVRIRAQDIQGLRTHLLGPLPAWKIRALWVGLDDPNHFGT